ncbi:MAG: hypothetical protein ABI945_01020 [Nitrospirales bacterium]
MATTRTTLKKPRVSLDRSIEHLRKQLAGLAPYLGKGKPTRSLEEFDLETEHLIAGWKAVCRNWRRAGPLSPRNARQVGQVLTGPQVAEHMSLEVRSLQQDASLRERRGNSCRNGR